MVGTVAVVGLGLIGGSLARRLSERGVQTIGWDPDAVTRAGAEAAGVPVAESLEGCVAGEPDLIILAVPLATMESVAWQLASLVAGDTIVTDVGSVKAPVRRIMERTGLHERYVGSHPMAGSEKTGFEASVPGLFSDAMWVVTIEPETRLDAAVAVIELVTRALGSRVVALSDDQHDEAVALISQLPHVLAACLVDQAARSPLRDVALSIAAGSYRDGTRVALGNSARTTAMVEGNSRWVAPVVQQVADRLSRLSENLRAGKDVAWFFDSGPDSAAGRKPEAVQEVSTIRYETLDSPATGADLLARSASGFQILSIDLSARSVTYRR